MKHIYFQVFDVSRKYNTAEYAYFGELPINSDLAGQVKCLARWNKSSIDDIRLYIYPSKKAWNEVRTEWLKQVKLSDKCK